MSSYLSLRILGLRRNAVVVAIAACTVAGGMTGCAAKHSTYDHVAPSDNAKDASTAKSTYMRRDFPVHERVADLLTRMSVDEKAAQLCFANLSDTTTSAVQKDDSDAPRGFLHVDLGAYTDEADLKRLAEALRQTVPSIQRYGHHPIPALVYASVGAGRWPRWAGPVPLALAATAALESTRDAAAAVAAKLRQTGIHMLLAPSLALAEDPRSPESLTGFGVDPHLAGEIAAAFVAGLQGNLGTEFRLGRNGVWGATVGFVGRALPVTEVGAATPVGERELFARLIPAFRRVIDKGYAKAIVASRSEFSAVPVHSNAALLQQILRSQLRFGGLSMADPDGIDDLHAVYSVASSLEDATRAALLSGIDAGFSSPACASLANNVRMQRVSIARLDEAVGRVLELKFRTGLFDPADAALDEQPETKGAEHALLAAARQAVVLLKNDGTLPYRQSAHRTGERIEIFTNSGTPGSVADAAAIAKHLREQGHHVRISTPSSASTRKATQDGHTDAAVAIIEGDDTTTSLNQVIATTARLVVIYRSPQALISAEWVERANAVIAAWGLGSHGAQVISEVLTGTVSPTGKLPVDIARSIGQLPLHYNMKPSARRGYLFESSEPLFSFGWGLGYASVVMGRPEATLSTTRGNSEVRVQISVHNQSAIEASEVIQLYVRDMSGRVAQPVKTLKAFDRINLAPNEKRFIVLRLPRRSLEPLDVHNYSGVVAAEVELMIGLNAQQTQSVLLKPTAPAIRQ